MTSPGPLPPAAPPGDGRTLPAVLLQMVLAIVPGQLIGFLLGGAVLSRVAVQHPGLLTLINVPPGLLAGLGLALVLTPPRARLPRDVGISTALGTAVLLGLLVFSRTRVANPPPLDQAGVVLGLLLTVGTQVVISTGVWVRKAYAR